MGILGKELAGIYGRMGARKSAGECNHDAMSKPAFDAEAAKLMSSSEVKKRFPRLWAKCPDCPLEGIVYASYEHYIAGDW